MWGFRRVYFSPDDGAGTGEGSGDQKPAGDAGEKKPAMTLEEALAKLEESDKALKITKAEAADRRRKLDAFEKAEKDKKEAELSELEKLKKQIADHAAAMEARDKEIKGLKMRSSWRKVAEAAKVKWASVQAEEDAFALIDTSKLTFDEQGSVLGLEDALKDLQKSRPYFFVVPSSNDINAGQGTGAGSGGGKQKGFDESMLRAKYGI